MDKKYVLGVDIGGTNTAFGIVDEAGNIVLKNSVETNSHLSISELFGKIAILVNNYFASNGDELIAIGVGAPNANYYTGKIENPPNLGWTNVDVVEEWRKFFDVPVFITNDANAAAIGEMIFGAAKGMKNFVEITLGTGLGSGIVVDGNLVYGKTGSAAELGHVIIKKNGRQCGCGRKGCLETYVSATGIKRTVYELLASESNPSELRRIPFEQLTSKDIFDRAVEGDKIALKAFDFTAEILGRELANAAAYLSPEAFILFGGLSNSGGLLMDPLEKYFNEYLFNPFKGSVKLLRSALPEADAAILGSSALAWKELSKFDKMIIEN